MMRITVPEKKIQEAATQGMDTFVQCFYDAIWEAIGCQLTTQNMQELHPDQVTLIAYMTLREEVMDGGFIQLIYNGYGPFIFLNPFAKATRLWGAREMCILIYDGRRLFEQHGEEIARPCTDEEFMARFEQYPMFDDLDDRFVEMEEEVTELVAHYIDGHIGNFVEVTKD